MEVRARILHSSSFYRQEIFLIRISDESVASDRSGSRTKELARSALKDRIKAAAGWLAGYKCCRQRC